MPRSIVRLYFRLLRDGGKVLRYQLNEDKLHVIVQPYNKWDCPIEFIIDPEEPAHVWSRLNIENYVLPGTYV